MTLKKAPLKKAAETNQFFLPDFCGLKSIFVLTIGAELIAIVFILATGDRLFESWDELGLLSIFVQWIALGSAAALCVSRKILSRLPVLWSIFAAYLIIISVTLSVSYGAEYFIIQTKYQWGDNVETFDHFMLRCVIISGIIALVAFRYFYMQQQWKERIELESEARVQALQSRIRPHFLFNSMNIIASLISSKPALAEQAVEDLSELFRATLKQTGSMVSMSEEWMLCRHYLRIEGLRLGDRLQVDWQLSDIPDDAAIPMLSLQPLVENAIYHGIQPLPEGGLIQVLGSLKGGIVEIKILNPLPGSLAYKKQGHGIALENIRHRLNLLFGSHATLSTEMINDQYQVILSFPYVKATEVNQLFK